MIDEVLLKSEEKAIFALRSLYKKYGYSSFKMSKFEEYDFYAKNKGFLESDNIITFNDVNGKLMALKPDVTLSIIKNGEDRPGMKQKFYYNENIYRVSERTGQYREIMQTGLENIGDIDFYDIFETIFLAAKSLQLISEEFVLDVSHLGILPALIAGADVDEEFGRRIISCLAEKNIHGIKKLCGEYAIEDGITESICKFAGIYGSMDSVTERLESLCKNDEAVKALDELKELSRLLGSTEFGSRIRFDFSVVNNMHYYNGIVFRGFLNGISEGVLAGGQYDRLMRKMRRKSGAVGFAVYMDLLEDLDSKVEEYDVDTLLIYGDETNISEIIHKTDEIIGEGRSVSVYKNIPDNIRYRQIVKLTGEAR